MPYEGQIVLRNHNFQIQIYKFGDKLFASIIMDTFSIGMTPKAIPIGNSKKQLREATPRSNSKKQLQEATPRGNSKKRSQEAIPKSSSQKQFQEAILRSNSEKEEI